MTYCDFHTFFFAKAIFMHLKFNFQVYFLANTFELRFHFVCVYRFEFLFVYFQFLSDCGVFFIIKLITGKFHFIIHTNIIIKIQTALPVI